MPLPNDDGGKPTPPNGFTVIEILLVTILIAILAGISIPRVQKFNASWKLKNSTREFQSFLQYLIQCAIAERTIVTLSLDDKTNTFSARFKNDPEKIRTFHVPVDITVTIEQPTISFYPDGNNDHIKLTFRSQNEQSITLTTKGVFGGIKVEPQE
jgi:prepilin-type N-terminal cleavage/methylation domain-containing protein